MGFEGVKPIVEQNDPELADDARRPGSPTSRRCSTRSSTDDGFTFYDDLTPDEVKELANAVNALSEPLSQLTAAVLS